MMDVAFINRWGRGGGVIWDIEMAKHLQDLGVDVSFYIGKSKSTGFKHPVSEVERYITVPTIDLIDYSKAAPPGFGGMLRDIDLKLFVRRVNKKIDYSSYDVVHVNSLISLGEYIDSTPSTIKLNGPPRSLWHDVINPYSSSYDRLGCFDQIIATGITTARVESETDHEVTTVNPGVDETRFIPDGLEADSSGPTILWVGRFAPVKNLNELILSFNKLRNTGIDAELVLVGDGPLRSDIERKAEKYNIRDSIRFEGYISHEKLPSFYRGADIFALSSRHESFGMVLLEAMACGTPVVAPQIDYIPEIVSDRQTGLLYESGDSNDMYVKMRKLLENSKRRRKMGQNAREAVVSTFTWKQQAEKLISCYEQII